MLPALTFLQELPWWSFMPFVGLILHFGLRLVQKAVKAKRFGRKVPKAQSNEQGLSFENSPIRKVHMREVMAPPTESIENLQLPMVITKVDMRTKSRVSTVATNIPAMPATYWVNLAVIAFLTTATGLTFALIPVLILALLFLDFVSSHNAYRTIRRRILRHLVKRRKAATILRLERQLQKATQARKSSQQAAAEAASTDLDGPFEPLAA